MPARVSVAGIINIFGPWEELGNPVNAQTRRRRQLFRRKARLCFPVHGKRDAFIFMADRLESENAIDGRYVWLPIEFKHGVPMISWHDEWDLGFFEK